MGSDGLWIWLVVFMVAMVFGGPYLFQSQADKDDLKTKPVVWQRWIALCRIVLVVGALGVGVMSVGMCASQPDSGCHYEYRGGC